MCLRWLIGDREVGLCARGRVNLFHFQIVFMLLTFLASDLCIAHPQFFWFFFFYYYTLFMFRVEFSNKKNVKRRRRECEGERKCEAKNERWDFITLSNVRFCTSIICNQRNTIQYIHHIHRSKEPKKLCFLCFLLFFFISQIRGGMRLVRSIKWKWEKNKVKIKSQKHKETTNRLHNESFASILVCTHTPAGTLCCTL